MCLCVVCGVSCVDGGSQFLQKKGYVENGGADLASKKIYIKIQ